MSITMSLFQIQNDRRSFKRTINREYGTREVEFVNGNVSLMNPIFKLKNGVNNLLKCNWVYVEGGIDRYYFVDHIELVDNHVELHCSVDVLYTYKDSILAKECMIKRQENNFAENTQNFFYDDHYPILQSKNISVYNIGSCANNYGYYLTVNGGVS